jgi:hypothetical protein
MRKLLIISCSDPMLWYATKIGQEVELLAAEADCYLSREDAGYVNIVKKSDAIIISV